jgi:hypothetical protein
LFKRFAVQLNPVISDLTGARLAHRWRMRWRPRPIEGSGYDCVSITKFLRIQPENDLQTGQLTGINLRLPADADLNQVEADIAETFSKGAAVSVAVEMGDNPLQRFRVIINGKTATHVLLAETAEPDGEPVLDLPG